MQPSDAKVFISYAREDGDRADRIFRDLQRPGAGLLPGITPFIDRERLKLEEFRPALHERIRKSDFILALLSRNSITSRPRFVHEEWDYCIQHKKLILPVLLEAIPADVQVTDVYRKVTIGTHVDLAKDYRGSMAYLLRMLFAQARGLVFGETFSALGPDQLGWDFGGWALSSDDHTGHGSQSLHARANPTGFIMSPSESHRASILVEVGDRNHLEYWRKINLKTANIFAKTSFLMIVDDGEEHVVEELRQETFGEHAEGWGPKTADLSDYEGKTVALKFVVSATDQSSITSSADVCIDDICISSLG